MSSLWSPGYQATESEVADTLEMSRTPVREALLRLESEGLVRMTPRRGMYVVPLSAEDMREVYEILAAVESLAAELLACRKPDVHELEPLRVAIADMDLALVQNDVDAWAKCDRDFHEGLANLCANGRAGQLVHMLNDQTHRAHMILVRLRSDPVQSNADHKEAYGAILDGNWRKAGNILRQHRMRGRDMITGVLEEFRLMQL